MELSGSWSANEILFCNFLAGAKRAFDLQFIPRIAIAVHSRTGHWDSIYFTSLNTLSWGGRIFVRNDQKLLGFTTDSLVTSQLSLWGCHVIWFRIAEISSRLVETRRSPKGILEADLMSQPIERTQNFCRSARKFRWFNRLKQIFCTSSLRFLQSSCSKNVCSWKNEVVTFMNFTLTVKIGTHDVVSIFLVMNLLAAILYSERSWEFSHFYKFDEIFCTNSRRERAYCWEWLRKI
jgi:hypothetical protein